ncbi:RNA polymerase sigma-70 factor [Streptomyces sp. NPDC086023]|uniref:RNA polymerase sigma-70 factor n=1 Tax=Streptomyces sp. NPDC086023 TaxID=3365746 RepID=UPI0037D84C4F
MIDSPAEADVLGPFSEHRRLLFATAYRMLGSVADAEDVLQDAWLKWAQDDRSSVENPKAYLVRTVTNLSLNRLTSARAKREAYVGPWLPEPMLTQPDVAEEAERADSVSTAMLVVLESLSPLERAVFVLREVFGYAYAEIATVLDRTEATVRQTAHRARSHVQARLHRFDTDTQRRHEITERFLAACAGGDLKAVMELMAPDVTAWSDGGGIVRAALRPLHGPDKVARWILGVLAKPENAGVVARHELVNGEEGLVFSSGDHVLGVLTYDVLDGVMLNVRLQANPEKLRHFNPAAEAAGPDTDPAAGPAGGDAP